MTAVESGWSATLSALDAGEVDEVSVGMNNAEYFRQILKKYPKGAPLSASMCMGWAAHGICRRCIPGQWNITGSGAR